MRKNLMFLVFTVGTIFSATAQDKGQVEFGVNVGFNTSTVSSSTVTADYGNGFNAGFSADYYFSKTWSLKTKLIYDQKGWNNGFFEDDFGSYNTNYNLNYLTIPLMANWHFGRADNWYLNFGPYAGFLLNAKETTGGTDVKDAFNKNDFGLAVGVGVKIPVSTKLKLSLEYDAQGGFSDIFDGSDIEIVTGTRGAFNVGLNFLLK